MQLAHLVHDDRCEQPPATENESEQREEHEGSRERAPHRQSPLEESHDRQQDVRQDRGPDEWPDDVARAVDDIDRADQEKGHHQPLRRPAPTSHRPDYQPASDDRGVGRVAAQNP